MIRVAHYLNQFYGRLGGETAANTPLTVSSGVVGPGVRLQQLLGPNAQVVATLICGDNRATEEPASFAEELTEHLRVVNPDVLIAGPAFNAGRYGLACGAACQVASGLGIASVAAMHPENPGVALYRRQTTILPTAATATGMEDALQHLAAAVIKLGNGAELGSPEDTGYIPHGFRRVLLQQRSAAERALDMLAARLRGDPFQTEIPLPEVARVDPSAPVEDLQASTIALVTTSALVPHGNPDHLRQSYSTEWRKYSIDGLSCLDPSDWESIHGGFDTSAANRDPHLVVPLDVLRLLEGQAFGRLHPSYYVTAGVGTAVSAAQRMGAEIAADLVSADVGGVVLTST